MRAEEEAVYVTPIQSIARGRLQDVLLQSVHLKPSQSSLLLIELERFLALKVAAKDWHAENISPSGALFWSGLLASLAHSLLGSASLHTECTRPQ